MLSLSLSLPSAFLAPGMNLGCLQGLKDPLYLVCKGATGQCPSALDRRSARQAHARASVLLQG